MRGYATTRLEPLEVLRRRVQPGQPVRPGHTDHTTVRQVHQAFATGEQPLLTHRVPVVPWHTDIGPVSATTALMVASALPSILFFPYVCHRRNVPDDLLIALNPEEDSSLPYLVRILLVRGASC